MVWVGTGHPVGPTGEDVDFAPFKLPSCPKQDPQHSSRDAGWLHHQTRVKQAAQRLSHEGCTEPSSLMPWHSRSHTSSTRCNAVFPQVCEHSN